MAVAIAAILPVVRGLLETVRERSREAYSPVDATSENGVLLDGLTANPGNSSTSRQTFQQNLYGRLPPQLDISRKINKIRSSTASVSMEL